MSEKPKKLKRCVTHHQACDCREHKYQEMESTLKIISVWANESKTSAGEHDLKWFFDIAGIEKKCHEALNCLEGKYERS